MTVEAEAHVLRVFDLALFEGSSTRAAPSALDPSGKVWKALTLPNESYAEFVLDSDRDSVGPFDRVSLNEQFAAVSDPKRLDFSKFDLDFETERELPDLTVFGCAFETASGKCLKCDSYHVLDMASNLCLRCDHNYINFLDKCSEQPPTGSTHEAEVSAHEYSLNLISSFNNDPGLRNYAFFSYLGISDPHSQDAVSEIGKFEIAADNQKIVIFETTVSYSYDKVPPLFYYYWVNAVDTGIDFSVMAQSISVGVVSPAASQYVLGATMRDTSEELSASFATQRFNLSFPYKVFFENSEDRNIGLSQASNAQKILEISESDLQSTLLDA